MCNLYEYEMTAEVMQPLKDHFALTGTAYLDVFARIWREWEGDRGMKKVPNVGRHLLYSFLTTEPWIASASAVCGASGQWP